MCSYSVFMPCPWATLKWKQRCQEYFPSLTLELQALLPCVRSPHGWVPHCFLFTGRTFAYPISHQWFHRSNGISSKLAKQHREKKCPESVSDFPGLLSFIKFTVYLVGRNIWYFSQNQLANEWKAPRATDVGVFDFKDPSAEIFFSRCSVIATKSCRLLFLSFSIISITCYKSLTYQKHAKGGWVRCQVYLRNTPKFLPWMDRTLAFSTEQNRCESSL